MYPNGGGWRFAQLQNQLSILTHDLLEWCSLHFQFIYRVTALGLQL
jgi:hypothetical protein